MTGLIPRPFIEELLNRTDIIDLIDSYVPLKKRGNSYLACCPFHTEKTPSFNVVAKKQFYHCFGCGASGNAISFMMQFSNHNFVEAVESLAARLGLQVPREGQNEAKNVSHNLFQVMDTVCKFYQHSLKHSGHEAIEYLKNRKVSGEIARTYQLGFAPSNWHTLTLQFKTLKKELLETGMLVAKPDGNPYDRYRNRITFPIHDKQGRIIGFGGRSLHPDQKPKYLNSPETILFQKGRELYGLYQVLQSNKKLDFIFIVEGYMDVIALAQNGISNVVATLGTATSAYHIQSLSKYTKRLIFCFDGDNAGRQAAWRALENGLSFVNEGLEMSFMFLPEGHDPDSLIREEGKELFLQRIPHALPLNRYLLNTLTSDIDLNHLMGKNKLLLGIKPFLLKMQEGPYKQLLLDELARMTRLDPHRIQQLITEPFAEKFEAGINISRTPLRIAIAILLQHPEIASPIIETLDLSFLKLPQNKILQKLIHSILQNPSINTAALIELWRNTPLFEAISKLAAWDHQVPEGALEKEFTDIMQFLNKQHNEQGIQALIKKSREHGLSDSERLHLQSLLQQRHKSSGNENIKAE